MKTSIFFIILALSSSNIIYNSENKTVRTEKVRIIQSIIHTKNPEDDDTFEVIYVESIIGSQMTTPRYSPIEIKSIIQEKNECKEKAFDGTKVVYEKDIPIIYSKN